MPKKRHFEQVDTSESDRGIKKKQLEQFEQLLFAGSKSDGKSGKT
jgi:hypothetical protein